MLSAKRRFSWLVLAFLASVVCCGRVFAVATFQFAVISSDDPSEVAGQVGSEAFLLEVSKVINPVDNSEQALFTFKVLSGSYTYADFFIDGVYFYDGALLGIAELIEDPAGQVDFTVGATPGHLPGIDLDNLKLVTGYQGELGVRDSADADPDPAINGIGAGESLGVLFDLQPGGTYEEVIAGMIEGSIIVGVKAQGFGPYSESFIAVPVPAPGGLLLGSLGVGIVGLLRKRKAL